MGQLRFEVTIELLHHALKLPDDVRIVRLDVTSNPSMSDTLRVYVDSPIFPEGVHSVTPTIHREPVKYTWDWSNIHPQGGWYEPDRD